MDGGTFKLLMLWGICFLGLDVLWGPVWAVARAILRVLGGIPLWVIQGIYIVEAYLAVRITVHATAAITRDLSGRIWGYEVLAVLLLAIFLASDQIRSVWIAYRFEDSQLKSIMRVQPYIAGVSWLGAVLILGIHFPLSDSGLSAFYTRSLQQALDVKGLGVLLGVLGIFYELRIFARIVKFSQVGVHRRPPTISTRPR